MQAEKAKDILDPALLEPILERSLAKVEKKGSVLQRILAETKEVKEKAALKAVLDRSLLDPAVAQKVISQVVHKVRDEKNRDLLDPLIVAPILQKMLYEQRTEDQKVVEKVTRDLKVKRDHGFVLPIIEKTIQEFAMALGDDLNISAALAALFDMVREVNTLCDQDKIGISESEDVLDCLKKIDQVLGVLPLEAQEEEIPIELVNALHRREVARAEKNWQVADECRALIEKAGYFIEDTPQGARLKRRE